jgi:hypothetical protein
LFQKSRSTINKHILNIYKIMSGVFFIFLFSDKICLNCTKVRIICTLTYIAHLLRNTPENIITPLFSKDIW